MFDFVHPPRALTAQLVAGRGHYHGVVEALMAAQRSVWIATANLKELMVEDQRAQPGRRRTSGANGRGRRSFRSILAVFDELAGRGVEVRVLHASPPSGPFRRELARHPRLSGKGALCALAMRSCPRVHLKLVIVDGSLAYMGSANFTGAGLGVRGEGKRNFELGIVSRDDPFIDELQRVFDALWTGQGCTGCKLRELCPAPLDGRA